MHMMAKATLWIWF